MAFVRAGKGALRDRRLSLFAGDGLGRGGVAGLEERTRSPRPRAYGHDARRRNHSRPSARAGQNGATRQRQGALRLVGQTIAVCGLSANFMSAANQKTKCDRLSYLPLPSNFKFASTLSIPGTNVMTNSTGRIKTTIGKSILMPALPTAASARKRRRVRSASEYTLSARSEERRVGKECRSRWSPYH